MSLDTTTKSGGLRDGLIIQQKSYFGRKLQVEIEHFSNQEILSIA